MVLLICRWEHFCRAEVMTRATFSIWLTDYHSVLIEYNDTFESSKWEGMNSLCNSMNTVDLNQIPALHSSSAQEKKLIRIKVACTTFWRSFYAARVNMMDWTARNGV
jgi:hypothetical protein